MLDSDLAELYEVPTGALNQAVRRNIERFPENFMFQLSETEAVSLRSQIVISKNGRGGRRYTPYAFSEHGIVMLSSVLNSPRAIQVSIMVVETFIRLREATSLNKDVLVRVEKLERKHERTASVIEVLVEDIDNLAVEVREIKAVPPVPKRKIGFKLGDDAD